MTQIPRKPTFPSYSILYSLNILVVQKLRAKIQSDVQEDVIPVSTGIYSYEKLKNKLEAIPKPQIENYEDKIFFEIIQDRLGVVDKTGEKCRSCDEEYNMKKNPAVMCNFCGIWCCASCIPTRKRSHPLSKDGSGKRYNVCQRCDTKYLNLQLGHSYVQNRSLLQQAIVKTSEELQNLMNECQEYQEIVTKSKQAFEKNKFKISQLRKEKLQLTKEIKSKMPEEIKMAQDKQQEFKVKFVDVHLKHREWLELHQFRKKAKEEKDKQRRQKQKQEEKERLRILQKQKLKKQKQQLKKQQQQQQRQLMQRRQRERLRQQGQQQEKINMGKIKRTPSLQQNSTFSMSLNYTNSQTELQKKRSQDYGGYDSYRMQESQQEQEIRARQLSKTSIDRNYQSLTKQNTANRDTKRDKGQISEGSDRKKDEDKNMYKDRLQEQNELAQYFRQSNNSNNQVNRQSYEKGNIQSNNYYQTPIKQIYQKNEQSTINNYNDSSSYVSDKVETKEKQGKEQKVNNFSFNDKSLIEQNDRNEEQNDNWNYLNYNKKNNQQKQQNNISDKEKGNSQQQYTFQNNHLNLNNNSNDQNEIGSQQQPEDLPISVPYHSQQYQQNNKLSYIDQWYINNKNKSIETDKSLIQTNNTTLNNSNTNNNNNSSQQKSSLLNILSSQQQSVSNLTHKNKKTSQQLQEQCSSQLGQQQLQVARYSLIKAARDSAVQQRQRNKIYQKSIHQTESAPHDPEEEQGVGEIKKCQCTIY